jgi:hypothetical protein
MRVINIYGIYIYNNKIKETDREKERARISKIITIIQLEISNLSDEKIIALALSFALNSGLTLIFLTHTMHY